MVKHKVRFLFYQHIIMYSHTFYLILFREKVKEKQMDDMYILIENDMI